MLVKKPVGVSGIQVTIPGGKKVILTLDEARRIYNELAELFAEEVEHPEPTVVKEYIPLPYPEPKIIRDPLPPPWTIPSTTPCPYVDDQPRVWMTAGSTDLIETGDTVQ